MHKKFLLKVTHIITKFYNNKKKKDKKKNSYYYYYPYFLI